MEKGELRMEVLVVCSSAEEYNTSSMLCLELVCKGLLKLGHKVYYLSPLPDKNSKYFDENHNFEHENLTHIRFGKQIEKTSNSPSKKGGIKAKAKAKILSLYRKIDLFGRSIETLKYASDIESKLKEMNISPDVLLSASNPKASHVLANKIIKHFAKKPYYVQYWGDPMTLDISKKVYLPKFVKKSIEEKILKAADKIVYVSHLTAQEQRDFFPRLKEKIEYQPTPCESKIYPVNENKCIGYFGSYNTSVRNIVPLYEAVNKNKKFKLFIIGDSNLKLESTEYVEVIDRIPAEQLEIYYNKCGIIANLTNDFGFQIPAKIFRDAGTNKEVMLLYNKSNAQKIKDYFSTFERFTLCENEVDSICSCLENYIKEGIKERTPLESFNYVNVSEKIIQRKSDN